MKKLFLLFLFIPLLSIAKWQRVIVPKMDVAADSAGQSITCFAFCIDAVHLWAPHNTNMRFIYSGANTTTITLSVENVPVSLTLQEALDRKYISIISYMPPHGDYNGRIRILWSSKRKIRLAQLSTKGFAVGCR